ncbi:hydroxyisourate hydrolase [Acuticoccus sediminis]|uniref:5-hydroxyisourate hydrolase n=1 Tax=Acuticoccus sediminis TaxID=2184697 RepID=A0A8B2NIW1_9HYPH|nr:hydroxyisourate hydrolase [Acuticoccus sediminis]RAH99474.1 hydroxyisourate hydrolase [Acuticoccus sediminis]
MAGRLTTHVLDTVHGTPASGVAVTLCDQDGNEIASGTTNADGRLDGPILDGDTFLPGRYTLEFGAGDYFRRVGLDLPEPAFLDVVVIAFGIADASSHYHVPLLISPYSYSTYRGS